MKSWVLMIGMLAATVLAFWVPGAASFQQPDTARIIFFHLPCAFVCAGLVLLTAWFATKYLATRRAFWDIRLAAAIELAFLFCVLTLVTGIVFSRAQWGAWWQWDPRQTSFLMVFLMMGASLALRAGIADEVKRASASATYAVATVLPLIFLIFVFPRLPHIKQMSFHPTQTVNEGLFDGTYRGVLLTVFVLLIWSVVGIYRMRVRLGVLELALDDGAEAGTIEAPRVRVVPRETR